MKVAICFRETAREAGGGFTFEASLVDELLSRATAHELVFVGPTGDALDAIAARGGRTAAVPIEGLPRVSARLPRPLPLLRRQAVSPARRPHAGTGLDRTILATGADAAFSLGPDVPSVELPFGLVVWDLQHRRQPWFPEVSADGVWAERERYYARVLSRATWIVTGTDAGRSEIERYYGIEPDRISVLPHPTPVLPPPDPAGAAAFGLTPGRYVLYPAQLWPHKNHVLLLEALRILRDDHGIELDVALTGSDKGNEAHVRQEARALGVDANVRLLGFVSRPQLAALYADALALAYVTLFGPENLPPLEAFSVGCPVIATRVAGAEEQLGDAAVLVDPRSATDLAAAIANLAADASLCDDLVRRGHERATRSTPATFVEGILRLLDEFEPVRRTWPTSP